MPSIRDYAPYKTGGPLHLINMTINQTVEFTSQRGNRDRKGENLAVEQPRDDHRQTVARRVAGSHRPRARGPWPEAADAHGSARCICPAPMHPLVDKTGAASNRAQMLSLRQWMAISGAAVGPGQGQTTQLGTALLFGLANLRTGYWWNSGITETARDGFPQVTVLPAARLRPGRALPDAVAPALRNGSRVFPGRGISSGICRTAASFEVLGAYELIRRHVPRIIVSDASADPQYQMESIANLIRKARLDFNATIEPFTAGDCAAYVPPTLLARIGTLDDLRAAAAAGSPVSHTHAALFWVRYAAEPARRSVLLYIKASVTGDEAADILQYRTAHPAFPHEPTADQFFNEEQWESYRSLGAHVMSQLCGGWFWAIPLRSTG